MFYVYLLHSNQLNQYYVGQTDDLRRRLSEHKTGLSGHTSKTSDWTLVYYEAYTSRKLAMARERRLKAHARGYQELLKRAIEKSGEG